RMPRPRRGPRKRDSPSYGSPPERVVDGGDAKTETRRFPEWHTTGAVIHQPRAQPITFPFESSACTAKPWAALARSMRVSKPVFGAVATRAPSARTRHFATFVAP